MAIDELRERLQALTEANEVPLSSHAISTHLSEEQMKEVYLDLIAQGQMPDEAARELGKTGRWCRAWRREKSSRYDPEFALRYEEIMRPDGEHREGLLQRVRAASIKAALEGNVRAQEKWLMALDPEFAFLKPAQFTGDFNVEKLMIVMKDVPTPILQQVRQALESKQRELPDIEQ